MSKSGTLRVKSLFKLKSHDKESKEQKRLGLSPKDDAASPGDRSGTLPASPGPLSPGGDAALPGDVLPISPKEKKGRRLLPFKLKRKKSKRKEEAVGEVFFPDELDSFGRHLSYDQISVSTECSFRTESDWDPYSESTSMISFDMDQTHSPTSPSKFFKSSEEKRGVLDRLSNFFNSRRKKSGRHRSDASTDASSPASPLSPCSPQSLREDVLKTPTPSKKDIDLQGDTVSQSSTPSASSIASLLTDGGDLPFADSDSSGSVREVHVCTISTASGERNSGNVTPTALELATAADPSAEASSELGFAESVVEEVCKRLHVRVDEKVLKDTDGCSEDCAVNQTAPLAFKIPLTNAEAPKSPNLTSISLASKKTLVQVGQTGHRTALRGVTLGSQSSTSHLIKTQQQDRDSPDAAREHKRRGKVFSWDSVAPEFSPSPEKEQVPTGDSPVQLHKAIWVETHLGAEEDGEREGEKKEDIMEQEEEGIRADSPPVLAIPVTVIPEDDSLPQCAADRSATTHSETLPSSGSPPESAVSLAATTGDFQTTSQPEEPEAGTGSRQGSLKEKRRSRELRVTRKTVNLPSKHKAFAHKVHVSPTTSLDGTEPAEEELSGDSTTKISDTTEVKQLPSLQNNNNVEVEEANLEPLPTTDETSHSDTNTQEPVAQKKSESEASDFDDTSATSDMYTAKSKAVGSGTSQATPSKRGVKTVAESRHTTASGAKTPSSAAGGKAKNVTTKAKASAESTKVGTSSYTPPQTEHRNDKTASVLPTLKDQSTSGPSSPKSSKSKIPKRSASDTDVKSPVTTDKASVSDASGAAVPSKLQKPTKTKEALKSQGIATKAVRKHSFEEAKGGQALSGDITPSKTPHKTGTKLIKERSGEDSINPVNGVEADHNKSSIEIGHPTDRKGLDVKKQGQTHLENNASATSKSRLPVSSPAKKTNDETTPTSGTSSKKSAQTDSDRSKTVQRQSPELQEATAGVRPGSETPPPLPGSPKKGSTLPTRTTKHLSKRSISHEESDTPTLSVSQPPTKQEKTVSSRLSKHNKSPVKDSADPSAPVSKLPTRGPRSPNKIKSRKHSATEDSNQDPNTETAVKASESVKADQVKVNAGGDRSKLESTSTEEQENIIKHTDDRSSISENKLQGKETHQVEESISSPAPEGVSKNQPIQSNKAIITENTQVQVTPDKGPGAEVLPCSEIAKAPPQSPVTDVNIAETGCQEGPRKTEPLTEVESPTKKSHVQSDNTTQEHEMQLSPKICPEEVNVNSILETTQPINHGKPDLIQTRGLQEPNPEVLAKDTTPAHEDVTDMSAKPVLADITHSDIMSSSEQEGVIVDRVSLKDTNRDTSKEYTGRNGRPAQLTSKDQDAEQKDVLLATVSANLASADHQNESLKDQTTNLILKNDRLPTLSKDLVNDFEKEEKSKEETGRKPAEALVIQTEAVCELPKNVGNQLDKEPLLLAGEFARQDSKPNEKLNDAAGESADSPNSCEKELKGITVEDEAEKDITTQKLTVLASEEKRLQPDSEEAPQTVVTDVLEEKKPEAEPTRRALHENADCVVKTKQECEVVLKDNAESGNEGKRQQVKTSTVVNEQDPKVLLGKDEKVGDKEANQRHAHIDVKKSKTPERNAVSAKTATAKDKSETKDVQMEILPNEISNEATDPEVRSHKEPKTLIAGDQEEDITKPEENAPRSGGSKCPNANPDQKPETQKGPGKTTESQTSQMDPTPELEAVSSEIQSADCTKEKTETKGSPIMSLTNENAITNANSEVSIQQDQMSVILRDQPEDTTRPDISKSTESKQIITDLKPEPAMVRKEAPQKSQENKVQVLKMESNKTQSAKGTKEKTETKESPIKSSINETTTLNANSEVSIQQDQMSVLVRDQDKDVTQPEKNKSTPCSNSNLEQEPETVRSKVQKETMERHILQTEELHAMSTEVQRAEDIKDIKDKTETKDPSVKSLVNKTTAVNANYQVSDQLEQKSVIARDPKEDRTKPDTSKSTKSKCLKTELKQELVTDGVKEKTGKDAPVKSSVNESTMRTEAPEKIPEIPKLKVVSTKTQSTDGQEKTEAKDSPVKSLTEEVVIENANSEVSAQKNQKSSLVQDEHVEIKKPEKNTDQATDLKALTANPVAFAPEKAAGKTEKTQKKRKELKEVTEVETKVQKQEDQRTKAPKTDAKQESGGKKGGGDKKDTPAVVPDEVLNSADPQTIGKDPKDKPKTDSGLKQEVKEQKTTSLGDSGPAKSTLNGSVSPSGTAEPPATSPGLQPEKESPSSWLDVEHQKRKKEHKRRLNASASEDESLEPDNFEDFVRSIKEGSIPFSLPPKRHIRKKSPSPPFTMPAIKEDRFEFNPEEFQFGLRKPAKGLRDPSPAMVIKQKAANREGRTPGKRAQDHGVNASRDQMKTLDEAKGNNGGDEGTSIEAGKEEEQNNGEEPGKLTSRLERMSILSSLLSSPLSSRKTKAEAAPASNSTQTNQQQGLASVGEQGVVDSPLLAVAADKKGVKVTDQGPLVGCGVGTLSESALNPSSAPPALPSFSEIKLPDHLEKYLKKDKSESQDSIQTTQTKLNPESAVMDPALTAEDPHVDVSLQSPALPLPMLPRTTNSQQTSQNGLTTSRTKIPVVRGFHKRPGKMVVHEHAQFGGRPFELCCDVEDATAMKLSPVISVRVIRGCWLLYEKPGFQGRIIALEEGPTEQIVNMWAEEGTPTTLDQMGQPVPTAPMVIGSVRLAVRDYSMPRIDLFAEVNGLGRMSSYCDEAVEIGSYAHPQTTGSIKVHSGVWLVYTDPGFGGFIGVLEVGEYPCPETWGFPEPFIGSLRPLRMGPIKVENVHGIKALVFEKPNFDGECLEVDGDVYNLQEEVNEEGTDTADEKKKKKTTLSAVGSIKILGGLWVGYQEADFEGQQYLLEEGEYPHCSDWGGSEDGLLSVRPVCTDFLSPHVKLFSERHFDELGLNVDLLGPVPNMEDISYGCKTQSVNVMGGV